MKLQADREWKAGLSEAIKVALLKDPVFFEEIERDATRLAARDESALPAIVERSAQLHLEHITCGGDPFELNIARPLDFGHWAAHKLETMTAFELRHGEAVAVGLAIDVTYAALAGHLDHSVAERVVALIELIGLPIWDSAAADHAALFGGLEEFREHLGGELTITLIDAIGSPLDVHAIDHDIMRSAFAQLANRAGA